MTQPDKPKVKPCECIEDGYETCRWPASGCKAQPSAEKCDHSYGSNCVCVKITRDPVSIPAANPVKDYLELMEKSTIPPLCCPIHTTLDYTKNPKSKWGCVCYQPIPTAPKCEAKGSHTHVGGMQYCSKMWEPTPVSIPVANPINESTPWCGDIACRHNHTPPLSESWEERFTVWHKTFHDETGFFPITSDYISFVRSLWLKVVEEQIQNHKHSAGCGEVCKALSGLKERIQKHG